MTKPSREEIKKEVTPVILGEDSEPFDALKVHMADNSIFVMPHKLWQKAFDLKYSHAEAQAIRVFVAVTKKHWNEKTIPTKFGVDEKWSKEYQNQADLGKDVMYVYIRAALFAVIFEEYAKRTGQEQAGKVLGLRSDGKMVEYTGHSVKEVKDIDEVL